MFAERTRENERESTCKQSREKGSGGRGQGEKEFGGKEEKRIQTRREKMEKIASEIFSRTTEPLLDYSDATQTSKQIHTEIHQYSRAMIPRELVVHVRQPVVLRVGQVQPLSVGELDRFALQLVRHGARVVVFSHQVQRKIQFRTSLNQRGIIITDDGGRETSIV